MSTLKKVTLTVLVATVCFANLAQGQDYGSSYGTKHYGSSLHIGTHPVFHGYHGYHGYNWNYHRGYPYWFNGHEIADVIRSGAQANLLNAHARTQNEVARSARLDNNVKQLNTHLERRAINSRARFAHLWAQGAKVRAEKEAAAVNQNQHLASTQHEAAERLQNFEVNPATGRLHWPLLLQMEHFSKARQPVNQVFAQRSASGTINPDHYLPLCDWIEKIDTELDKNVHDYPEADYAEAKDFLRRLVAEARLPATTPSSLMQLASK